MGMTSIWFYVPSYVIAFIQLVGLLTIATFISKCLYFLKHKITNQEWPKNIAEFKIFQLIEEKKRLLIKIEQLESENMKILDSVIHHLKETKQ